MYNNQKRNREGTFEDRQTFDSRRTIDLEREQSFKGNGAKGFFSRLFKRRK
jgi:hypothetical protein